MDRLIFHVDVNSAFLSWEAARRVARGEDDLRLIPSAVGGDPNSRRSIIAAKSIPAKKYDIQTGEPVSLALRKCPQLVVVPPDFDWYRTCSKAFIEICREYAPALEQFSIDECFLDMTGTGLIYPNPVETAYELKNRIRDELGFTVNVGIGNNKLLAKMASDFEKPDKVHTLYTEEIEDKMWPLPIGDLFLAGKSSTERLIKAYIRTIGDLAKRDVAEIKRIVGDGMGQTLHDYANGIDNSPVVEEREEAKSFGMSTTLDENVVSFEQADEIIRMLSENVSRKMRNDGAETSCIGVTIRTTEFKDSSHQRKLDEPTDITSEICDIAGKLIRELWDGRTPLRLINVSLSGISRDGARQISLFDNEEREKARKLDKTMDGLIGKYGKNAIVRGSEIKGRK